MQLRNARLCLDCEEVHDASHCPICASESFAFVTRWVPSPGADQAQATVPAPTRTAPRERQPPPAEPVARETLDTYRQLLGGQSAAPSSNWRFVKRGALGLAIFGLAGWAWKQQNQRANTQSRDDDRNPQRD